MLGALLLGGALLASEGWAATGGPSEYQVKAVFLFNFSQFVEWPPGAFADRNTPFIIGVLGQDPFGTNLDEAVRGETVNGRPLVIRRFRSVADIEACHILFIDRTEIPRVDAILAMLNHRSTLTVSDFEGFAQRGVMIRFINEKNRIRLRIDVDSARAAGLTISSKLLRPAQIVSGSDRGG
jgi:hypothetical protein